MKWRWHWRIVEALSNQLGMGLEKPNPPGAAFWWWMLKINKNGFYRYQQQNEDEGKRPHWWTVQGIFALVFTGKVSLPQSEVSDREVWSKQDLDLMDDDQGREHWSKWAGGGVWWGATECWGSWLMSLQGNSVFKRSWWDSWGPGEPLSFAHVYTILCGVPVHIK